MKHKVKLLLLLLACTILVNTQGILAQPNGGGHGMRETLEQLNLSVEQRQKIREMMADEMRSHPTPQPFLKDRLRKLYELSEGDASSEEIDRQFDELKARFKERNERARKLRTILTPEQVEKLKRLRQEKIQGWAQNRKDRWSEHREHKGEMRGRPDRPALQDNGNW